jgi:hypothetical protein
MKTTLICLLVLLCAAGATQESRPTVPHARTAETATPKTAAVSQADIDALTADLTRMRSILQQMELNLGFLPAGPTPAKHQFELEVDMWRAMLDHMDRRLQAMRAEKQ